MNYLAHAYLSFGNGEILVGNLISDFVKGKKKYDYSEGIRKGIALHRYIDAFTDDHPITREAKTYFKPAVGLYAGAFMDVVYDHFLAKDGRYWQEQSLAIFAQGVYDTLEHHYEALPEKFQHVLPYMKAHDWLSNYRYTWGIQRSFEGIARRATYLESADTAFEKFNEHYGILQTLAEAFIPVVKKHASQQFELLLKA